jgi:hypothetical protein
MKSKESGLIFNLKDITKKTFDDRWVKFAFGPQGKIETKNFKPWCGKFWSRQGGAQSQARCR